jgi:hypothetical protein
MNRPARQNGCPDEFDHLPGDGVDGTGLALVFVMAVLALLF